VATATRVSGNTSLSSALVFDEVAGGWLAVAVTKGTCQSTNAERWEVFSLQPRPGGTFTGEYSSTAAAGCGFKQTVTFTRTGDARVDNSDDPASLPARVVSPAQALHGRYHLTMAFTGGGLREYDLVVRTDCLRAGVRCMSFFYNNELVKPLVFANGKWTWARDDDAECPAGGASRLKVSMEYPLPAPPQDPTAVLTGHGRQEQTGACALSIDFDEKFERTGD
jgi:serine/threonine-protein kinase